MTIRSFLLAAALAGTSLLAACNSAPPAESETATSEIAVEQPWSRETAPGQTTGGGYMTIRNTGGAADRLIGGSSPVAREVQIHTVDMSDGVMRMRELADGLEIPAGQTVALEPGGYHLMLMGLEAPLARDVPVPLTLQFEQAGSVEVELSVQPAGAEAPMEHEHHG